VTAAAAAATAAAIAVAHMGGGFNYPESRLYVSVRMMNARV
jgi:hypothetical protein